MFVGETLELLTHHFQAHGIEEARVDAEWLLAHILNCRRLDLFLNIHKPLSQNQKTALRKCFKLRIQRQPLQYILGTVQFYNQTIKVDRRALIPRPETEEMIYQVKTLWASQAPLEILDLGTGSGAIAIALASLFPKSHVAASDAYADTLRLAIENAQINHVNIRFYLSHWFEKITHTFDCIISNPPYLTEQEWDNSQPEIKKFEPKHALVASENGLNDLKQIVQQGIRHLNKNGLMLLETGIDHHDYLHKLAKQCGYTRTKTTFDLQRYPRYFWAWR